MSNGEALYSLFPFVRQGVGALVTVDDPELRFRINNGAPHALPLRVYGPGDITGFDPRVVVRLEPPPRDTDFESNYFVAIEFDRPDFPWLFSPPADSSGHLLPWICLIVLRRVEGTEIKAPVGDALPSLSCAPAELPDLGESWAWAHAQVLRTGEPLARALVADAPLNVSRLLCPRRLETDTPYLACVVPTFKAGVEAGLGHPVSAAAREPAWRVGDADVTLPVYYHWEFRTGPAGDFETLAKRIRPRVLPERAGRRDLDVTAPGFGLPGAGVLGLEGVLRPARPRPAGERRQLPAFQKKLQALLNEAAERESGGRRGRLVPVVAPPIYARWHAAHAAIDASAPGWLRELNLDPRYRSAASFGALVVQRDQEQLMASAWDQLGEIQRANQLLRQAQLARGVSNVIHSKRLKALRPDRLVQIAAPTMSRLRTTAEPKTLRGRLRDSVLPIGVVSPTFRRITRPYGPIARKLPPRSRPPLLGRLASAALPTAHRKPADGMLTVDIPATFARATAGPAPRFEELSAAGIRTRPSRPSAATASVGRAASRARDEMDRGLRDALAREFDHVRSGSLEHAAPPRPALPLGEFVRGVIDQLTPTRTIPARLRDRLGPDRTSPPGSEDPLEPIMARPEYPQPMYEALRAISQDLILPGLEHVPRDTVHVVEVNWPFVEAYMAGLNHEMNRELLWREFPTDQRGTSFRYFWDAGEAGVNERPGIRPLNQWNGTLGTNSSGTAESELLVLLIRAELLRRYPGAILYMAKATRDGERWVPGGEDRHPLFRGSIDPDVVFVGFRLTLDAALGRTDPDGAGWYLVIQEQPSEPRFGFENESKVAELGLLDQWPGLGWDLLAGGHLTGSGHLNLAGPLAGTEKGGIIWGRDAAQMAAVTLQRPFRIALHAQLLLQPAG